MMRVSGSETNVMPVCWRRKRLPRLLMPWRLPTTPCFTLPVAVKRKRFLAPLLVFILGIFVPFQRVCARKRGRIWQSRLRNGGFIDEIGRQGGAGDRRATGHRGGDRPGAGGGGRRRGADLARRSARRRSGRELCPTGRPS